MNIKIAEAENEVMALYDALSQLRPQIKREDFLSMVKEQAQEGYRLAFGEDEGKIVTVSGFRFLHNLARGKFLYVDDLVTCETERSKGYGDEMMEWLIDLAKNEACQGFHLDSAVYRHLAHRFYFKNKLKISCYHFELDLKN